MSRRKRALERQKKQNSPARKAKHITKKMILMVNVRKFNKLKKIVVKFGINWYTYIYKISISILF